MTTRDQLQAECAAKMGELPGDTRIGPYLVALEAMWDSADLDRGVWIDCWVRHPGGQDRNGDRIAPADASLACLEGEGEFENGEPISDTMLDRIRAFAERHGY